jgi:hypothetical protein
LIGVAQPSTTKPAFIHTLNIATSQHSVLTHLLL